MGILRSQGASSRGTIHSIARTWCLQRACTERWSGIRNYCPASQLNTQIASKVDWGGCFMCSWSKGWSRHSFLDWQYGRSWMTVGNENDTNLLCVWRMRCEINTGNWEQFSLQLVGRSYKMLLVFCAVLSIPSLLQQGESPELVWPENLNYLTISKCARKQYTVVKVFWKVQSNAAGLCLPSLPHNPPI